jgi:hypothetical protein
LHLKTNRLYISRHVTFDEHSFPFSEPDTLASASDSHTPPILTPLILLQDTAAASPSQHDTQHIPSSTVTEPQSEPQAHTVPASTDSPSASPSNTQNNSSLHNASSSTSHHMLTRTKTQTRKPKEFPNHQLYLASEYSLPISKTMYKYILFTLVAFIVYQKK